MKNKPTLTIFYQFDPWRSSIGGIQTFICSFLKYAPPEFEVRLVGTGDQDAVIGKWTEKEFLGRSIKFMPLIKVENDNIRKLIPTTLKYTAALLRHNFSSDFMHFYRIEAALATRSWNGEKTLLVQNDIQKQMDPLSGNNSILWQKFPTLYFALESYLIKQFNYIYSCHTKTAQFYQQRYPQLAEYTSYLKNTVDEERFFPLELLEKQRKSQVLTQELGLAEDTKFVLFAGRLHPQKDPLLLIEAFAHLNQSKVHLLMAGTGELKPELEAKIDALDLSKRVTILGAVPQSKLAALHQISDVFVLSSVYEGLPFAVLEALSCGTPVVTTDSGETPDFLAEDSGIVCYERTPEAIADALAKILHSPDLYPSTACVRTAKPYSAKSVVTEVYQNMFERWESSSSSSRKVHLPLSLTS
ncbi:glycoside hydrolase [Pleurocapsa sp. CCALA 161]|uniref:glycosyltransferase family 4 protein n=1 Tax=Pleurocapsa sp. CCALA 161 TaxID=2107688 RepID=UPI000D072F6D|nr:glycosyltransferase family 4 protein [Pleurocapsa sp. CCALA 161]PSB08306.1 glycoside hydrolase [Pleurocapsa sp. CCALA 161]